MQSDAKLLKNPALANTLWSACVPPGQGCGALEPSTHRYPSVQLRHSVLPASGVNVPAAHSSQVGW